MQLILDNPFRVLGLSVTASERETARRISDLTVALVMGKTPVYDTDFPCLGPLERTVATVRTAAGALEQPRSRLFHSLSWFWDNTETDQLALLFLREGEVTEAAALWAKASAGAVNRENFTGLKNHALLYLVLLNHYARSGKPTLARDWRTTLALLSKFAGADANLFAEQAAKIAGPLSADDRETVMRDFFDELSRSCWSVLDGPGGLSPRSFAAGFTLLPERYRSPLEARFFARPLDTIDRAVRDTESKRQRFTWEALKLGQELAIKVNDDLVWLRRVAGEAAPVYSRVADRVAFELLHCVEGHLKCAGRSGGGGRGAMADDEAGGLLLLANFYAAGGLLQNRLAAAMMRQGMAVDGEPANTGSDPLVACAEKLLGNRFAAVAAVPSVDIDATIGLIESCQPVLESVRTRFGPFHRQYLALAGEVAEFALQRLAAYLVGHPAQPRWRKHLGWREKPDLDASRLDRVGEALGMIEAYLILPRTRREYARVRELFAAKSEALTANKFSPSPPSGERPHSLSSLPARQAAILGGTVGVRGCGKIHLACWIMAGLLLLTALPVSAAELAGDTAAVAALVREQHILQARVARQAAMVTALKSELNDWRETVALDRQAFAGLRNENRELNDRLTAAAAAARGEAAENRRGISRVAEQLALTTTAMTVVIAGLAIAIIGLVRGRSRKLDYPLERDTPLATVADHSFAVQVADELHRMTVRAEAMPETMPGLNALKNALRRLRDRLRDRGYELADLRGERFIEGMKVKAGFVPAPDLAPGERVITRVIRPRVSHDGKIIQPGEVEVGVGPDSTSPSPLTGEKV